MYKPESYEFEEPHFNGEAPAFTLHARAWMSMPPRDRVRAEQTIVDVEELLRKAGIDPQT